MFTRMRHTCCTTCAHACIHAHAYTVQQDAQIHTALRVRIEVGRSSLGRMDKKKRVYMCMHVCLLLYAICVSVYACVACVQHVRVAYAVACYACVRGAVWCGVCLCVRGTHGVCVCMLCVRCCMFACAVYGMVYALCGVM